MKPRVFFLLLTLLFSAGCGASVSPAIMVPDIPEPAASSQGALIDSEVFVASFLDERLDPAAAKVDDKETKFVGSVPAKVEERVAEELKRKGFGISEGAATILRGKVKTWQAEVTPGMSGTVNAKAVLQIEIRDPADRKIYGGRYEGSAFVQSPGIGDEEVQQALAAAMSEAVGQLGSDSKLINLLSSF